ncbi:MAG TPA: hypothetical protein VM554_01480 [Acidisarcina sp.]|nr:hypothetical protein [Acidisarcina sp.]
MKKFVFASLLAVASITFCATPFVLAQNPSGQITIKDPAEYNAYTNAIGQSDPKAKAAAIEAFLSAYPQSVVKSDMLEQLMAAYQASGDLNKTVDAAGRLLQIDPGNVRALALTVYIKKAQAAQNPAGAQPLLDDAAALAQRGLNATKPANMAEGDFDKLKKATTPIFHSAIATDDVGKKDFKGAVSEFHAELESVAPEQTTSGPSLNDTYMMGSAYIQMDPKDLLNGIWYLARAAAYAPEPAKSQIDAQAKYWYNRYHGGMDGYETVQALAKSSVFPTADYKITPAPSPQEVVAKIVAETPDLKTLALSDKEFILANGKKEDADKLWSQLKDVTTKIPGVVVAATPTQIQLAVSEDAKTSKVADFTVNMKSPLKTLPATASNVELIATFDSYTASPAMIVMKDGELPEAKKPVAHPAPVHRHK